MTTEHVQQLIQCIQRLMGLIQDDLLDQSESDSGTVVSGPVSDDDDIPFVDMA